MDGLVYLLHFSRPYHHAKHYVGYTQDLEQRYMTHLMGMGSPLVKAVVNAGIEVQVAKIFVGDRYLERAIKDRKNTPQICPICQGE